MAIELYLKIDGVEGEATQKGHEKEIQLTSFQWGFHNPSSPVGKGSGAGKVEASGFNCSKVTDKATPLLLKGIWTGQHFPKAKLTAVKAGGKAPVDYLVAEFDSLYITNLDHAGHTGGQEIPSENVSFAFGKVAVTYNEQKVDGTKGAAVVAGFDFKGGVEA